VILQLDVKLRTPTPPKSSSGLPPMWESKTPSNPTETQSLSEYGKIRISRYHNSSPSFFFAGIEQIAEGAKRVMHRFALLEVEVVGLPKANEELSRRRRIKKNCLREGGSLTVQDGQNMKDQRDVDPQIQEETRGSGGRARGGAAPTRHCGKCGKAGHNARTCQEDTYAIQE
jgi:hypothetical protein